MKIFLIGFMGSGKTHWGKQLAAQLHLPFFDLDEEITTEENREVTTIFTESGEEYFRMLEKDVMYKLIDKYPSMVLSCGGGTPCFFNNIKYMKKMGTVVWLNTNVDVLMNRLLKEKTKRPLIREIDDRDLKTYIIRKLNERRMYYELADVEVENENSISPAQLIQTILHA